LVGIACAVYPEVGLGSLTVLGIIYTIQLGVSGKQKTDSIIILIALIVLTRAVADFELNNLPWRIVLEGILMWMIYQSAKLILQYFRIVFSFGLLIGLITISIFAAWNVWFAQSMELKLEPLLAKQVNLGQYRQMEAVDSGNAWVLQLLGMQGSGQVRYSAEFRAEKPIQVSISLLHEKLTNNRVDVPCSIQTDWTTCQIIATLPTRASMIFVFGGYGSWKLGSPTIDVRNEHLDIIEPPTLLERVLNSSRAQLWAFNENALGVWLTVLTILAIGILGNRWLIFASTVFVILGVFTSGSRGALAALGLGLVLLTLKNIKYFRAVLIATTCLSTALSATQIYQQRNTIITNPIMVANGGFRAIQPNDPASSRSRLEIFRLAWLAFKDSPWFGVGDLQKAMIVKYDARAQSAGLARENLTHAHNLWLQVAGESGVFGLLAMMALWIVVFARAWRTNDRVALICLAVLFLVNLTDYFFYYAPVQINATSSTA
jgi:O-Antigen ligase